MWNWGKTCDSPDATPSVTMGSCKGKTVLNLDQKAPKGATTKIQIKDMRDIREIK